nr:FAD-dependent oxidoreductase [uncultured Blautia sp.]
MTYDVGIIGSGPAGLSAAIYAKRANLSAVVIEKEYEGTGQIAESGQVDNYLGLPGISGYDLGEQFREHAVKLGVSFLEQEVTEIKKEDSAVFTIIFEDGSSVETKTVIYAAGATPRRANIPGEQEYSGKGVSYCAICDGSFYRGKKVAVLGGGDTALDDAVYLADLAEQVYVIHRRKEFRGAATTVEKLRKKENVTFVLEHQVKEITGAEKVNGVVLEDGTAIAVDGVFVAYGSVPQTNLVKELVTLDAAGYVKAEETGETSLAGLYVAGDARTKKLRQVVTAVSDGANAATAVVEYLK